MGRWFDYSIAGGLFGLIVWTPVAFGSVHPWAFMLMELIVFLLVLLWVIKTWLETRHHVLTPHPSSWLRTTAIALCLFVGLIGVQLLPLPPSLLGLLSPSTYEVYQHSLPGWPTLTPYLEHSAPGGGTSGFAVLSYSWQPMSLATAFTVSDLLKVCAYIAVFFLVLGYPFAASSTAPLQQHGRGGFVRRVVWIVLITGFIIALLGVMQHLTWNGKLLWFFVPYDWDAPQTGVGRRASGPFVNADHFANYLAMVLPLAIIALVAPRSLVAREHTLPARIFAGVVTGVVLMGLLLSLSRGAWGSAVIGMVFLVWVGWVMMKTPQGATWSEMTSRGGTFLAVATVLLGFVSIYLIGPTGRTEVGIRLGQTFTNNADLGSRVAVWQDSLSIVRDFPLLGVGFGAWAEIFPRYQRPPWSPEIYREAHNDYLELIAETGLLGAGTVAWLVWWIGRQMWRGLARLPADTRPLAVGLMAGLVVMLVHAAFDFPLQIPANALLFTVYAGLVVRLVSASPEHEVTRSDTAAQTWSPATLALIGLGIVVLLAATINQPHPLFPASRQLLVAEADARAFVLARPASARGHVALFRLQAEQPPSVSRLAELRIALWLDPRNPMIRDLYAASLLQIGQEEEGLREFSQSVALSPAPYTHPYLPSAYLAHLSGREQQALERGLQQAFASGYRGAVEGLGEFYHALGRFADEGRVYEMAARQESVADAPALLLQAAAAYARGQKQEAAETLLREVIARTPHAPQPYVRLIADVLVPRQDLAEARATVSQGIRNGAQPVPLLFALADAAQAMADTELQERTLQQVLALQPFSFDAHMRLGVFYLAQQRFDRAVLSFRQAVEINPRDSSAFSLLGQAEESRYQFAAAESAYTQAVRLAPENTAFQRQIIALQRKIAQGHKR